MPIAGTHAFFPAASVESSPQLRRLPVTSQECAHVWCPSLQRLSLCCIECFDPRLRCTAVSTTMFMACMMACMLQFLQVLHQGQRSPCIAAAGLIPERRPPERLTSAWPSEVEFGSHKIIRKITSLTQDAARDDPVDHALQPILQLHTTHMPQHGAPALLHSSAV